MVELQQQGWDLSAQKTKILMLTHNVLAQEQGYRTLAGVFDQTDLFIKKEDDYIAFFADRLEPACEAHGRRHYGLMFAALGTVAPKIHSHEEKVRWVDFMDKVVPTRTTGTVADLLQVVRATGLLRLPDAITNREELADVIIH